MTLFSPVMTVRCCSFKIRCVLYMATLCITLGHRTSQVVKGRHLFDSLITHGQAASPFSYNALKRRLQGGADATTSDTIRQLPSQAPSVKSRRMFAYPWETLGERDVILDYYKVFILSIGGKGNLSLAVT